VLVFKLLSFIVLDGIQSYKCTFVVLQVLKFFLFVLNFHFHLSLLVMSFCRPNMEKLVFFGIRSDTFEFLGNRFCSIMVKRQALLFQCINVVQYQLGIQLCWLFWLSEVRKSWRQNVVCLFFVVFEHFLLLTFTIAQKFLFVFLVKNWVIIFCIVIFKHVFVSSSENI
jgi:hypothetical protein